jgi:hypothetical protein
MKSIKPVLCALLLTAAMLSWVSCKKENATKPKTTQEKILGKWNWISEVTNDYYSGMSHINTYNLPAGDYMDFKTDGNVIQYNSGSSMTYGYGAIDETKIWLVFAWNIYAVKLITETDLQIYKKDVTGADYYESTLNFKRE